MPETPEQRARREIDRSLTAAGWLVQSADDLDLTAGRGVGHRARRLLDIDEQQATQLRPAHLHTAQDRRARRGGRARQRPVRRRSGREGAA